MATGNPPFRTAAAATYCIFVSKQLPALPAHLSEDAHYFLSRCLVENSKSRATCQELILLPFLTDVLTAQQSTEQSAFGKSVRMSSTVSLNPLSEYKGGEAEHKEFFCTSNINISRVEASSSQSQIRRSSVNDSSISISESNSDNFDSLSLFARSK